MEDFKPYRKRGNYHFSVPATVWKGLQFPTAPDFKNVSDERVKCILRKLGSKTGNLSSGERVFSLEPLRIDGVPYDFAVKFYWPDNIVAIHILKPRSNPPWEQSYLEVSPWQNYEGRDKIDRMTAYAQEYGIELPANWTINRDSVRATQTRLRRHYEETVVNPSYTAVTERLFTALRTCTDEAIHAMNVGAEKGLPPLALEKYLGVPEPAKGSEAMKAYYKEHAARGAQGGRKKSRRQKKRRATRRR